jgi:hypothetical protein
MDQGQIPFSVLYEVYTTNADLEFVTVVHQGFDRDIAETKMYHLYRSSGYGKDFVLWNRYSQVIEASVFSSKTKQLRGECQG